MKREKWILKVRNTLATLAMECDSSAAIDGAEMSKYERKELQNKLKDVLEWIDDRI